METLPLPNFIGLGAARSGTTSLYRYLNQHPRVYLTPLKETHFFTTCDQQPRYGGPRAELAARDTIWRETDYRAQFEGVRDETALGEICPTYLHVSGTAERIHQRVPKARLFAVLRNPVDRAVSSFALWTREGMEPCRTLAEAIEDEPRRLREQWRFCLHVVKGYYARQLREYHRLFDRSQIRIYLFDDFVRDPIAVAQSIFGHIGVDEGFVPDVSKRYKVSGVIKNPVLRFLWTRTHPFRARVYVPPSNPVRRWASDFFGGAEKLPVEVSEETRRHLLGLYREDTLELQDLIGRDLAAWLE